MRIRFLGVCTAFDRDTEREVSDPSLLRTLDGYKHCDDPEEDCFSYWLIDEPDSSPIKSAGVSKGYLEFSFDEATGLLISSVEYDLERPLNEHEVEALKEFTTCQCSDGIGANFLQFGCDSFPINVSPMDNSITFGIEGFTIT